MSNSCEICGPDVGPYAETHMLVAALNGEREHLAELVAQSYASELRTTADALELMTDTIGDRLGYGGP
jgi:hypothetical protein